MGPRKASSPNLSRPSTATSGESKDLAPALSTSPSQSDMEILDALKDASSAPSSSAESLLTPSSSNSPVSRRSLDDSVYKTSFSKCTSHLCLVLMSLHHSIFPILVDRLLAVPLDHPVHFPTMSVPTTPQSASSKRSFTGTSTPSSPSSTRMKRPSLTLLFKRSNPSLTSTSPRPIISNPIPQSADSEGSRSLPNPTPIVAAPPTLPPSPTTGTYPNPVQPAPVWIESSPSSNTVELPMRSTTPTPIADLYSSASSSSVSLASSSSNEPYPLPQVTHLRLNPGRARQPVQPIVEDSKHADLRLPIQEDEYDDDWTNTVLLAADVDWSSIPTRS
ncbi:hypothetical protein DL96DRAFT_1707134 [Flagelloscypha sp. PMI_526]|nr:hypothetical protein DL96DRAFT_1707134 [Flagelloscypha sp. PMI_526]